MKTALMLAQHIQEHGICGIDGCKFTAHPKVIAKHVQMQHLTGLYHKICKADTPEDISKWIEDRKRRYPSKENVERHKAEQQEKQQRGERLDRPKKRFNEYVEEGECNTEGTEAGQEMLTTVHLLSCHYITKRNGEEDFQPFLAQVNKQIDHY
ncbi:unnamed protein product [Timema podura]|uniref:FMR1-interacting protein 1 conserved domain-containing protein n=1 Tax=Timema podura TaxID=61482 RepID=A0ABN7P398_TIMPD|nr:unnamed protein product [Timema podura]